MTSKELCCLLLNSPVLLNIVWWMLYKTTIYICYNIRTAINVHHIFLQIIQDTKCQADVSDKKWNCSPGHLN